MVIAYLRISTGKQHIANQQDKIMRFALSKDLEIHKWVTEVVSGKKAKKERKLGKTLRRLKQGDILIVTELSRLSRTLTEIMSIVGECLERKITIYSTKDGYAFDDSINSKVLCFALRRAEGIQLGRRKGSCTKLQILIDNRNDVIKKLKYGQSIIRICRDYGVSRDTFNKFRNRYASVQELIAKRQQLAS